MCGICGFCGKADKTLLKKMNSCLAHRGPDGFGEFEDEGISLGHRRLKVIDLSENAKQPMQNEDGTLTIVFNGEIYNFLELKKKLKKRHSFKSDSDTEIIIHLYEEIGAEMLPLLDGMFAFALWDSRKKELLLARDPLGKKPLFYTFIGGEIFFASEIKALLQAMHSSPEPNMEAFNELLCFRAVLSEHTLFKGIKKLLPGHFLLKGKATVIRPYWELKPNPMQIDENSAARKFMELFEDAVKKRLISDVPLGAFLSGGVDSSAIVATMSKFMDRPVKTFTVGFGMQGDEFAHAKKVSEKFGTDHEEVVVGLEEMTKELPKLIWHMDEPMADIAFLPVYFLTKKAREKITVSLLGEGADEMFGGYKRYQFTSGFFKNLPKKQRAQKYLSQDIAFRENERKHIFSDNFLRQNAAGIEKDVCEKYFSSTDSFLDQALLFDAKEILPNYQLARVDRVTMSKGLEARAPFLDKKMAEFAFSLPEKLKVQNQTGKYIVKKAFLGTLPKELLFEKKRIFFTPVKKWFDESFEEVAKSLLDEKKIIKRNIFSSKEVKKKFWHQKNGLFRGRNSNQLLMLAMIEIWFQTFIDRDSTHSGPLSLNELE